MSYLDFVNEAEKEQFALISRACPDGREQMNVWIRLYALLQSDGCDDGALTLAIEPKISIVVHRTEQSARQAAAKHGGLVLEVNANSLKGQSEFDDPALTTSDTNEACTSEAGQAGTTAFMIVACDDIPYRTVFHSFETGDVSETPFENGEYEPLMKFTEEGIEYLDTLQQAMGTEGFTQ
jgi:hypothetical protein